MKKENLSPNKNLFFLFFESILEIINEFSLNSDLLAKICIFFNFTHIFSYLCSIFMRDTEAESANAIFQIIYFSNYMNLIHLTGSFWLKLTIFIIFQIAKTILRCAWQNITEQRLLTAQIFQILRIFIYAKEPMIRQVQLRS